MNFFESYKFSFWKIFSEKVSTNGFSSLQSLLIFTIEAKMKVLSADVLDNSCSSMDLHIKRVFGRTPLQS